nr:MAG TPA: hypothetical protein [Caudoviricetes sp.]
MPHLLPDERGHGEATRKPRKTQRDRQQDRAARPADPRVQVPGGHEAHATSAQGETP